MDIDNSALLLRVLTKFAEAEPKDSKNKNTVVYMAINHETKDFYIGATTNKTIRKNQHITELESGRLKQSSENILKKVHCNKKFQESYNSNKNFEWKELAVEDAEIAFKIEKLLIDNCRKDDIHCLNIKGVSPPPTLGKKRNPELVQKLAKSNTGRKHSEETKLKQSTSAKTRWDDEILRQQQSVRSKNFWANLDENKKLEINEKNRISNIKTASLPENIDLRKKIFTEYWSKPEAREKQSKLKKEQIANGTFIPPQTGVPLSTEQKQKLNLGRNKYYAELTPEAKIERYKNSSRRVEIDGVTYNSIKEASIALNATQYFVLKRINKDLV